MKSTRKAAVLLFALLMIFASFTGCGADDATRDCLYQTALLQSLMQGDYYGSVSVKELKTYGDTGIGTFDKLNGELIMLDGVVYAALSDGTLAVMDDDATVPFSDVTFLDAEFTESLGEIISMDNLKAQLTRLVREHGEKYFYMATLEGQFQHIEFRSEYAQEEPYKPLATVMETESGCL